MEHLYAMVISAHPDDAEFGAAGTVARWIREGKKVIYVVCTRGEKGTSDRSLSCERLAEIRAREQKEAAKLIGVKSVEFMGYPDQGLEDSADFRKKIVAVIRRYKPELVVTSDPYKRYIWHRDHRITGQVVLDAVYPYARDHLAYPDLLEKGLEPHKVRQLYFWGADEINHRVDITDFFDLKISALKRHQSQFSGDDFANVKSWVEKRCREMAEGEAFELAEGFHRVVIER